MSYDYSFLNTNNKKIINKKAYKDRIVINEQKKEFITFYLNRAFFFKFGFDFLID